MSRIGTYSMLLPSYTGVLIVMAMAMLQQTAQTKSHHQAYQLDTKIPTLTQDNVIDPHLGITIKVGTITMGPLRQA